MVVFGSAGFDDVHDTFIVAVKENALARDHLGPQIWQAIRMGYSFYRSVVVERATTRR